MIKSRRFETEEQIRTAVEDMARGRREKQIESPCKLTLAERRFIKRNGGDIRTPLEKHFHIVPDEIYWA